MTDIAIHVEKLGKRYRIGRAQKRHDTLRDAVVDAVKHFNVQMLQRSTGDDTIWALKDVSFEVKRGEVVGIIGRNGAGKSTLLKILSRITKPTEGWADIHGRVGALLEVGTGFHAELTGRENILLNGAILGMKRAEIERKFDEIVAFAEIEKFIDTPVKHYSSGMFVRLAFAVAAHLEPEILLVDEVLAVGDAAFQKKSLGKMGDVANEGRTVLFVSHNMAAIESLCPRTMILDEGNLVFAGPSGEALRFYLANSGRATPVVSLETYHTSIAKAPLLQRLHILNEAGVPGIMFPIGSTVTLGLDILSEQEIREPQIGIGVNNSRGARVFTVSTSFQNVQLPPLRGPARISCRFPNLILAPDQYYLKITVGDAHSDFDVVDGVRGFEIVADDHFGTGRLPSLSQGVIVQFAEWSSGPAEPTRSLPYFDVSST